MLFYFRLSCRCVLGKQKALLELSDGARLLINENSFSRKDSVEIELVQPATRWRYLPALTAGESLASEIYTVKCSTQPKNPITVCLPAAPRNWSVYEPCIKVRDTGQWTELPEAVVEVTECDG